MSAGYPVSLSTGWGLSFILATLNGAGEMTQWFGKLGTRQEKWGQRAVRRLCLFSSWCLRISGELCLRGAEPLEQMGPEGPDSPSTLPAFHSPIYSGTAEVLTVSDKVDGVTPESSPWACLDSPYLLSPLGAGSPAVLTELKII